MDLDVYFPAILARDNIRKVEELEYAVRTLGFKAAFKQFGEGGWQQFYAMDAKKLEKARAYEPVSHLLSLIGIGVSLGLYAWSRERRYLRLAWRIFLATIAFALARSRRASRPRSQARHRRSRGPRSGLRA